MVFCGSVLKMTRMGQQFTNSCFDIGRFLVARQRNFVSNAHRRKTVHSCDYGRLHEYFLSYFNFSLFANLDIHYNTSYDVYIVCLLFLNP